jgi:hypothetical protein
MPLGIASCAYRLNFTLYNGLCRVGIEFISLMYYNLVVTKFHISIRKGILEKDE